MMMNCMPRDSCKRILYLVNVCHCRVCSYHLNNSFGGGNQSWSRNILDQDKTRSSKGIIGRLGVIKGNI